MTAVAGPSVSVTGVYSQPINEIVRPDRVWRVSKYLLRRWGPYLPPSHLWLIIGARQFCYHNQKRPWFTAYDRQLARCCGMHTKSFVRSLKKEIVAGETALAAFIERDAPPGYVRSADTPRQAETRYNVRLDDPLTPADATALAAWLTGAGIAAVTPATMPRFLEEATAEPVAALRATAAAELGGYDGRLTVRDVVEALCPAARGDTEWHAAADRLHSHIVESHLAHYEPQYLRQAWLPELGAGPALLLVQLRSRCYHNERTGEIRDAVEVVSGELEALCQKSAPTVRSWLQRLQAALPDDQAAPFIQLIDQHKRPSQIVATTYRINLTIPLTGDDWAAYGLRLAAPGQPDSRAATRVAKEMLPTVSRGDERNVTHDAGGGERIVTPSGWGGEENVTHRAQGDERNVTAGVGGGEKIVTGSRKKGSPLKDYKTLAMTLKIDLATLLTAGSVGEGADPWRLTDNRYRWPLLPAACGSELPATLDFLGVEEPLRSHFLTTQADPGAFSAWHLYARTQPRLTHPERYVLQCVRDGRLPPPAFAALADLSWSTWRLLAVCHALGFGAPTGYEADYAAWTAVGDAWRLNDLPFGVGVGLSQLVATGAVGPSDQTGSNAPTDADGAIWQEVRAELARQLPRATFNNWLRDAQLLERSGDCFVVQARNAYAQAWLAGRLQPTIERTLAGIVGRPSTARIVVGP